MSKATRGEVPTSIRDLKILLQKDLAKSGIDTAHAKVLKLEVLTAEETAALTENKEFAVPSYRIPYFDLQTGRPTDYFRLKFLVAPKPRKTDFASASRKQRIIKYFQPHQSVPRAYFPPNGRKAWKSVMLDISEVIYITEGEKKAACGCANGLHTIGLGGVWSWKSKKNNIVFLPELELVAWKGRVVRLAFDSDQHSNKEVMQALVSLGYELRQRGAAVEIVQIEPLTPTSKTGMDDFIVARGIKSFSKLTALPLADDIELTRLNDEIAVIESYGEVYHIAQKRYFSSGQLLNVVYANRFMMKTDQTGAKVKVNVLNEWLQWEGRRTHPNLVFEPGESRVTEAGNLNLWQGWAVEPKKGDVRPFFELIDYMFHSAPQFKDWFLQWLAYPIQHPGAKLFTATVLFSLHQGTGKSLLGYTIGKIYGEHFNKITQDELHSTFNAWAMNRQFILGEELTGHENRRMADQLNDIITRELLLINQKFQPVYMLRDCANYLLTTNNPDALFLNGRDRRFFIIEIEGMPMSSEFYKRYDDWKNGDGPAALLYHLLNHVDCRKFSPTEPAPVTSAKREMQDLSKSDVEHFAERLFNAPDEVLHIDGIPLKKELWTAQELTSFYEVVNGHRPGMRGLTTNSMTRALKKAGFIQIVTTSKEFATKRLIAVRNQSTWVISTNPERVLHYASTGRVGSKPLNEQSTARLRRVK